MAELAGMITTVWKQLSIDHWKRVAFARKYSKGQPCCAKNEGPPLKKQHYTPVVPPDKGTLPSAWIS